MKPGRDMLKVPYTLKPQRLGSEAKSVADLGRLGYGASQNAHPQLQTLQSENP